MGGLFKLVITDDEDGKTTVVPLVRDEITVGRKEGNTIRLTQRNVSRKHARFQRRNGAFIVEDLKSYTGVRVNGRRIESEQELAPGDNIMIGDYQLSLQFEAVESSATIPDKQLPAEMAQLLSAKNDGPPARLVMIAGPVPGAEYALVKPKVRVGRAEDLDIWVNHRSISREHAELVLENGRLSVRDLQSQNGVRVEGREVREGQVGPLDIIELGQVRFRYVPAGEAYSFRDDRAAVPALSGAGGASGVRNLVIGIVAAGLLGALVLWLMPRSTHPMATALPIESGDVYEASVQACSEALATQQFDVAVEAARRALAVRANDPVATACLTRAEATRNEESQFDLATAKLRAGDAAGALAGFGALPVSFRNRPEVIEAARRFVDEALSSPAHVASLPNLAALCRSAREFAPDSTTRRRADFLISKVNSGTLLVRATRDEQLLAVADAQTPEAVEPIQDDEPAAHNVVVSRRNVDTRTRIVPVAAANDGATAPERLAAARACTFNGDNRCVVRELNGRAGTEDALGLLIEAYRNLGDMANATRNMRTYVSRFPGGRRSDGYRRILDARE